MSPSKSQRQLLQLLGNYCATGIEKKRGVFVLVPQAKQKPPAVGNSAIDKTLSKPFLSIFPI
jgi:hypothetical protein